MPFSQDQATMEKAEYQLFFILEPLPKKFYDQNAIRLQSYEESLEHHHTLVGLYQEFLKARGPSWLGRLRTIPFAQDGVPLSPKDRAELILRVVHDASSVL